MLRRRRQLTNASLGPAHPIIPLDGYHNGNRAHPTEWNAKRTQRTSAAQHKVTIKAQRTMATVAELSRQHEPRSATEERQEKRATKTQTTMIRQNPQIETEMPVRDVLSMKYTRSPSTGQGLEEAALEDEETCTSFVDFAHWHLRDDDESANDKVILVDDGQAPAREQRKKRIPRRQDKRTASSSWKTTWREKRGK